MRIRGNLGKFNISPVSLEIMKIQIDYKYISRNYLPAVIRRHISACSSVVMEPHNSLITNENLLDD